MASPSASTSVVIITCSLLLRWNGFPMITNVSPDFGGVITTQELLLTSAMQRALQHALEAVDLERLPQGRSVAIGLGQLTIARGKDERRAAGNEGIGNRRGGLAFEIGVEDRNVEVGVLRRFQRLFDARGFGGDGVAELAEHVLEQDTDHRLVFDDEHPLGLSRGRFGCHPSPLGWNRRVSRSGSV